MLRLLELGMFRRNAAADTGRLRASVGVGSDGFGIPLEMFGPMRLIDAFVLEPSA